MAGRVLPAIGGPAEEEHGAHVTHGSDCQGGLVRGGNWLAMRTWSGARLWVRRPARALHPNRPRGVKLADTLSRCELLQNKPAAVMH